MKQEKAPSPTAPRRGPDPGRILFMAYLFLCTALVFTQPAYATTIWEKASDHRGEVILQMLCEPEQRELLGAILSEDLSERRPGWTVDNDAMDGESPVLSAYTCDMPRIRHFDTALELHGKEGTLICFDFQEEILRRVCGQRVKIQCLDFEKVKALLNGTEL